MNLKDLYLLLFIICSHLTVQAQIPKGSVATIYLSSGEVIKSATHRAFRPNLDMIKVWDSVNQVKVKVKVTAATIDSAVFKTREVIKIKGDKKEVEQYRIFLPYSHKPQKPKKKILVERIAKGDITVYRFNKEYIMAGGTMYNDLRIHLYVHKTGQKRVRLTGKQATYLKRFADRWMGDCPSLVSELKEQMKFSPDDISSYFNRYNKCASAL